MKEIVEYLLKMVIDCPDSLIINEIAKENLIKLEISADPSDIGKIIGRNGRLIKAIRTIASAVNRKGKDRTIIEIKETKNQESSFS